MNKIILVGTGLMAEAYSKVLSEIAIPFEVVGRGWESANRFFENTNIQPHIGGIENYLLQNNITNCSAIVATGTEALMPTLKTLLFAGADRILIEKPASLSIDELLENEAILNKWGDTVFVAYNRRFYSSVIKVLELIELDGGLQSMHFEFTEWSSKIGLLNKAEGVKENWFFANSTHVIDLAFFIAGLPEKWSSYSKSGTLPWHKKSIFSGAGITKKNVFFSYNSNWESPGRWAIELMTQKHRFYLKPLEDIKIQELNSTVVNDLNFDNLIDLRFKPGVFEQVKLFLAGSKKLLTLKSHINISKSVYRKILEGQTI